MTRTLPELCPKDLFSSCCSSERSICGLLLEQTLLDGFIPPVRTAWSIPRCLDFEAEVEAAGEPPISFQGEERERSGGWDAGGMAAPTPGALLFKPFRLSQPQACCLITRAVLNGDLYEISNI